MSNYVQTTFFAPKDSLPTGNPNKVIRGQQVDFELNSISTAIGSKQDQFLQTSAEAAAGVVPTNLNYLPLDVRRYGADPTGISDSTAAINAAVLVAHQLGGATITYPTGTFLVGSTTTVSYVYNNIYHQGDSPKTTIIVNASTNQPAISVGDGSTQLNGGGISNMAFTGKSGIVGVNGQTAFTVQKVTGFTVEGIFVTNFLSALYRGLYFNLCIQAVIHNVQIAVVTLDGFTNISATDTYMTDCRSDNNGGSGYVLNFSQGGYYKSCTAYNNNSFGWFLSSTTPATNPNFNNFFIQCVGDTSGYHNWKITDSVDSYWVGSWGSTQKNPATNTDAVGFFISTVNSHHLFFTGCVALYNNKDGFIAFDSGTNAPYSLHFTNCQGGSPGVGVSNGNGRSGLGWGLELTGGVDHVRIIGGAYESNASGSINLGSSGSDILVSDNPYGFVSTNQGASSVGIGNTSVTVTHGLGYTPALYNLQVNPTSSMAASSISSYWISNPTSTTFTVNTNAAVAATAFNFVWRGSYNGT